MDKKKLKIEIYDTKGELHDTVEGECDGVGLLAEMAGIVADEGIPVVRMENEKEKVLFSPYRPFEWEARYLTPEAQPILMKLEMKVDQQTLACEGFGTDVLKAQERFLRAIMPEFEGE